MVSESFYWKVELLRQSVALNKFKQQVHWREASFARCERTLMVGFYSIRKLIEADKLTHSLVDSDLPVSVYRSTKNVTRLNSHKIDETYDLARATHETRKLTFVCNQFIHSYVFIPVMSEKNSLLGICLSSDRDRNKQLVYLDIKVIADLFDRVAHDDRTSVRWTLNPKTGDYDSVDL